MDHEALINERVQKMKEMTLLLQNIDEKLLSLSKEFNWEYKKFLEEKPPDMVKCKFNSQHRVPISKIKAHEEKCFWNHQGYKDADKIFPEYSGRGSFVTLTPESLHSITQKISSGSVLVYVVFLYFILMQIKTNQTTLLRPLPETSANYDQNFNREEKLAIYDYVIANTQNQKSYSDLWLQPVEKTKEKREMAAWEIAAAERDAKRRRASYRNKVHTNRKTHTEILREVINAQMEAFESEVKSEKSDDRMDNLKTNHRNHGLESAGYTEKRKYEPYSRPSKEERDSKKSHDRYSKHREHKRSPPATRSDSKFGSRSDDKCRKWKTYEGRSHSRRSKSESTSSGYQRKDEKATMKPYMEKG